MGTQADESDAIAVTPASTELDMVRRALIEGDLSIEVDPAAIAQQIVQQIITAPSIEEAFKEPPVWHANENMGHEYVLRGVRWLKSSFDAGPSVFAAVDVVDTVTGEVGVLTTSAYKQLAKLYVLQRDGGFPVHVVNVQSSRPTAGGFWPLDFELVEQPDES